MNDPRPRCTVPPMTLVGVAIVGGVLWALIVLGVVVLVG